jgi:hypothetical protein
MATSATLERPQQTFRQPRCPRLGAADRRLCVAISRWFCLGQNVGDSTLATPLRPHNVEKRLHCLRSLTKCAATTAMRVTSSQLAGVGRRGAISGLAMSNVVAFAVARRPAIPSVRGADSDARASGTPYVIKGLLPSPQAARRRVESIARRASAAQPTTCRSSVRVLFDQPKVACGATRSLQTLGVLAVGYAFNIADRFSLSTPIQPSAASSPCRFSTVLRSRWLSGRASACFAAQGGGCSG